MKHERIRAAVMAQCWAMEPKKLEAMLEFLGGNLASEARLNEIKAAAAEAKTKANDLRSRPGAVAVLPLYGVISHRAGMVDDMSGPGGTSTASFSKDLWSAVNNPNVKALVIDCDSPGGSVEGVQELHDEIMKARGKKPITAVSDCQMASAALWICSAASEMVASPSAIQGSLGIFMAVDNDIDESTKLISYGAYKTEANGAPLSEDGEKYLQENLVNYYGDMFTNAVAAGRGVSASKVSTNFGQGRMLNAQQALAVGMVDRIATLDAVLAKLGAASTNGARMAAMSRELQLASLAL